jgi:hypothetical protein
MSKRTAVFRRVRRVVPVAGQGGVSEPMTRLYVVCSSLLAGRADRPPEGAPFDHSRSLTHEDTGRHLGGATSSGNRHPANGSEDSTG